MKPVARPYEVNIVNRGIRIRISGRKNLLAELEMTSARGSIVEGCRGGGCGICRIRVVSGSYSCDRMSKAEVSDSEAAQGYALACRLTAQSDLEIEVLGKRFRSLDPTRSLELAPE